MPQTVRMDPAEPGAPRSVSHHIAHAGGTEITVRRLDPDEYRPALSTGRSATPQILGDRPADVGRQRDAFKSAALAAHNDLARPPIDVVEPKPGHFARSQTETDKHGQNGDIPTATPRGILA
jgi:hypothetical protein